MKKSNNKTRIIVDTYEKGEKHIWGNDPETPFNQKIIAVNNMYEWLYNEGILKKISFEFKDYSDTTFFSFDVKDLIPYRESMTQSGVKGAALAIHHIFDVEYSPCLYCGAITLGWLMQTYRDFDGTVSKSWECGNCNEMNSGAVLEVYNVKEEKGTVEAVKLAFKLLEFEPSDIETQK